MIIYKISDNYQGSRWEMVYEQEECQASPYQENFIEKKIADQRRKIKENICKANNH